MTRIPSKVYNYIINSVDVFVPNVLRPAWEHPAGLKTVFFWGPIIKWGLVIAGISDLKRPAETLSLNQTTVLAVTGFIWTRYSMVIIPKNWTLFSVNFFVGLSQLVQLGRIYHYRNKQKDRRLV